MAETTHPTRRFQSLHLATALVATTGALHQSLFALSAAHGGKAGPWLDQLEARLIRDAKNMTFTGTSIDAETAAVDAAVSNLRLVFGRVRQKLAAREARKA
jgi:hypothetical protein